MPLSKPTTAIPEATILPPLLLTKPLINRLAVLSAPADAAIKPLLLMVSAKISPKTMALPVRHHLNGLGIGDRAAANSQLALARRAR